MIRVLIADDHGVVRAGLGLLLAEAEGIEYVGAATNGSEAIKLAEALQPDVMLMDISMPVLDGIAATERVSQISPATKIVMLTSFTDRDRILEALDAGAVGYLLKDSEPHELIAGIAAAARGDSPLHPTAAKAVLNARAERKLATERELVTELSEREREVLALVANGLPNKLIARRLGISEKTVKTHLTSIFRQIGVSDRTQAALWAERSGFAERS